ncbi:unnamed protein product [Rotaria sordida]|uniref:Ion transport domain-containing protein n=3 Tax=Rotaria sordida TaxID=392033 RepID=A0A813S3J2_9BILA|nr:unnamed protein product [Rotaria sordida]
MLNIFIIYTKASSARNAVTIYFKSYWNKLDVVAIILFFVGIVFRYISISECFCAGQIVISFDLSIWFIRTLDMFTAVKLLGPKLVMIGEMVHDLKFFMLMFFVFILAFGVQEFTWYLPCKIINFAYWHIFGEIKGLEIFEAPSARNVIKIYFKSYWNKLDVVAIILFFVGIVPRYITISECFCAARIILSFDLSIWFIRSLDMFTAVKLLGPKLVMIGEMVHGLKFFMLMFFVFILAFGVSFYSLVFGVQEFTWHLPQQINEMRGWMMVILIAYQMTDASGKSLVLAMCIQLLISAYLFLSAYSHFHYYWTTGNCQFLPFIQMLFKYNFLTITLCLLMNRDYQSYYYPPLISFYFTLMYFIFAFILPKICAESVKKKPIHFIYLLLKLVLMNLERHPFFLKEMPEDGPELHPAIEALQALKWDDEDDTPLGSKTVFNIN